jgi:hypothetical protein
MRRTTKTAAVGATLALVAGLGFGSASAQTAKELNVCWTPNPNVPNLELSVAADGPSYRERNFNKSTICHAWNVQGGQYKFVVKNFNEVRAAVLPLANTICPASNSEPFLTAKIKRFNKSYRTYTFPLHLGGDFNSFTTNVRENRRTSVAFTIVCKSIV